MLEITDSHTQALTCLGRHCGSGGGSCGGYCWFGPVWADSWPSWSSPSTFYWGNSGAGGGGGEQPQGQTDGKVKGKTCVRRSGWREAEEMRGGTRTGESCVVDKNEDQTWFTGVVCVRCVLPKSDEDTNTHNETHDAWRGRAQGTFIIRHVCCSALTDAVVGSGVPHSPACTGLTQRCSLSHMCFLNMI